MVAYLPWPCILKLSKILIKRKHFTWLDWAWVFLLTALQAPCENLQKWINNIYWVRPTLIFTTSYRKPKSIGKNLIFARWWMNMVKWRWQQYKRKGCYKNSFLNHRYYMNMDKEVDKEIYPNIEKFGCISLVLTEPRYLLWQMITIPFIVMAGRISISSKPGCDDYLQTGQAKWLLSCFGMNFADLHIWKKMKMPTIYTLN